MRKLFRIFFLFISIGYCYIADADEGMWLPVLIERLNYVDMQKMGLHLTAEELYSINNASLKDAIVGLGSSGRPLRFFCSASVISDEGLMLTNHHCGFDAVQSHTTKEHNYIENGFWAMSKEEELTNEGLTASFLIRMEDVTSEILKELSDTMSEIKRGEIINKLSLEIKEKAEENGKYQANVKSFFEGNEFYLCVYKTYKDIRLVGAPPTSIGQFGGDTDNWMWPRHTGDFALFRIYTAPDGSTAEYSKNNIPLKPKYYLPVSLKGIKKNDFAMVLGYPGGTNRFLSSYGVKLAIEETNPAIVKIRDTKLAVLKEDMEASTELKIKYATKYAQTSNYWKYFIGQTEGLKNLKVYEKKEEEEDRFQSWADAAIIRKEKYGNILNDLSICYDKTKIYERALTYYGEAAFSGPEIIGFSYKAITLYNTLKDSPDKKELITTLSDELREEAKEYFKDYNISTDKKLFTSLFKMFYDNVNKAQQPSFFSEVAKKYNDDFNKFADVVYSKSIFSDYKKLDDFLNNPKEKVIINDPGFKTMNSIFASYRSIYKETDNIKININRCNRLYVAGLKEMNPDKKFYSNANSTMRMSYGQVLDYIPADAIHYNYLTTIKGLMEKEDSSNEEFIIPEKLKDIYYKKDFGRYGKDSILNICFLTNHDITGGNSGSPVINSDGHLIGIAFDGNWEAMSGDIAYEPDVQRTINVDIRYVLFLIDKFAGATYLTEEMTIIE